MRLITIRFSHYNEKARWALDRFAVPYREEAYMPMMHVGAVFAATIGRGVARNDKVSTRLSTPVLITDRGERLCDSSDIVRYVSRRFATDATSLYPTAEAAELERRFHDQLGPEAGRYAMRLFREERGTRMIPCYPLLDDAGRAAGARAGG